MNRGPAGEMEVSHANSCSLGPCTRTARPLGKTGLT
ncbi:hypothetical protein NK6_6250 [Bradyrhizobium diazoefficiens]|uniref:Uncharacterized protein n=1 Tax=Bradyrhizobium diazoefficiens TaxID=1355477 RepID=A0A0E4FVE2_9BRAD|nr:hypothetical protein NK6_6250 [Bradyrhizobium diazoefficiens]